MKYVAFDNEADSLLNIDETNETITAVYRIERATILHGNSAAAAMYFRRRIKEAHHRDSVDIIADPIDPGIAHRFFGRGFTVSWHNLTRSFRVYANNPRVRRFVTSPPGEEMFRTKQNELNEMVRNTSKYRPLSRYEINKIVGQMSAVIKRNLGDIPKIDPSDPGSFTLSENDSRESRTQKSDEPNTPALGAPMSPEDF